MKNKEKIIKFANSIGIDTIGFTKCRKFEELISEYEYRNLNKLKVEFEEEKIEKRINPFLIMEEGKSIISIAIPYFHEDNKKVNNFSKYTVGEDYHLVVKKYLQLICGYIGELGGRAEAFVDNNPLPERYIAYLCGIGFVGKNNTFITEKYGSYIFLGEIITSLNLESDEPIDKDCGQCNMCIKACPQGLLKENKIENNFNKCLSYITQKKELSDDEIKSINGRIFGCDICQDVCPLNKNAIESNFSEFKALPFMIEDEIENIIAINNSDFKNKYKKCSCGWRGKNILIRNALIKYKHKNKMDVDNIEKNINSPYIKDYYNRLFKR